jgi:hypothetical protein
MRRYGVSREAVKMSQTIIVIIAFFASAGLMIPTIALLTPFRPLPNLAVWIQSNIPHLGTFFISFFVLFLQLLQRFAADKLEGGDIASYILVVLVAIAITLLFDNSNREKLIREVRLATEGTGDVKIFSCWNEQAVNNLIASAKRSVIFIDSWFNEGVPFSYLTGRAKQAHGAKLTVSIYLVKKNGPFGSQRLREIGEDRLHEVMPYNNGDLAKCYDQLFDNGIAELLLNANDDAVDLHLYEHDLMPGIRLVVIDNDKYLFSWFPLGTVSIQNICFCLSTDSVAERDQIAISGLLPDGSDIGVLDLAPVDGDRECH